MKLFKDEYHIFYQPYIDAVNLNESIILNLQNSLNELFAVLGDVPTEKQNFVYAEGKWSLKEVMVHIIDTERIMAYRALRISRQDEINLAGFDEKKYIWNANSKDIKFIDLLKEFSLLRKANILMFKGISNEMLELKGNANDSPISARALGYILSGHVLHHLKIIKERYL